MPVLIEDLCPPLTKEVIERCKQAGVKTILDFLSHDSEYLSRHISTSYKDVTSIRRVLLACYSSFPQNADCLYDELLSSLSILKTGHSSLDELLDGGIYTGEITEIHGPPCSGKTQLCLSFASSLVLETGKTVLYLDTNGSFTGQRVQQILSSKSDNHQLIEDALQKLHVIKVHDIYNFFDVLHYIKEQLHNQVNLFFASLKLIIIDSITALIAPCLGGFQTEGQGITTNVAQQLKTICYEHMLSIIVSNNTVLGEDGVLKSALGRYWKHVPSVTLSLDVSKENFTANTDKLRKLSVVKSIRRSSCGNLLMNICDDGITITKILASSLNK